MKRTNTGKALITLFILTGAAMTCGQTYFRYNGAGVGINVGLANPEKLDAALGTGAHLVLEWDLGEPGKVQYYPSVDYWFAAPAKSTSTEAYWGVAINPLGISYYFPAPDDFPVQVNAGFDIGVSLNHTLNIRRDPGYGIGLYGAINLMVLDPFIPFAELKLTLGSHVNVRTSLGATFRFGKPAKAKDASAQEPVELYEY